MRERILRGTVVLAVISIACLLGGLPQASSAQDATTSPSKGHDPRLHSSLAEAVDAYESKGPIEALEDANELGIDVKPGGLWVTVEVVQGREADARDQILAIGGRIEQTYRSLLQVTVPVHVLEDLARLDSIRFVSPTQTAEPQVISEGVSLSGASNWQSSGINGTGVKVAIIDTGFAGYSTRLGTELPSSVTAVTARADGLISASEHGTAVAEIVHDVAPGAQLYLIAVDTVVATGLAVDYAIAQGVDVINMSLAYLFAGNGNGTGPINEIVNDATTAGITWVNSSGNFADRHWRGAWSDSDADNFHNFSGVDETNGFPAVAGQVVTAYLTWNDAWSSSCNDYDFWIYDSSLTAVVASSLSTQNCSAAPPLESIGFVAPYTGTYNAVIRRWSASGSSTFNITFMAHAPEYLTSSYSIAPPVTTRRRSPWER